MKYIFLEVREDGVVTGAYVANKPKKQNDKKHQKVANKEVELPDGSKRKAIDLLNIMDKNGKYNCRYGYSLMQMTEEEKKEANKTAADILTEELEKIEQWYKDTDFMVLKVMRGNWQTDDQRYIDYLVEYEFKHTRAEEIKSLLA